MCTSSFEILIYFVKTALSTVDQFADQRLAVFLVMMAMMMLAKMTMSMMGMMSMMTAICDDDADIGWLNIICPPGNPPFSLCSLNIWTRCLLLTVTKTKFLAKFALQITRNANFGGSKSSCC